MKIMIQWLWDEHSCDTCGTTVSSGALIKMGDKAIVLNPVAHCFDGESWDTVDVFTEILRELGHELEIIPEDD
jgi:hypothetical protein